MRKEVRFLLLLVLLSMFVLIRAFEETLFYDPLIVYFQNNYLYGEIPEIHIWKLVVDILFRYGLNSLITLGIIYVAFKKKSYVKFTGFFLMVAFIVLLVVFVYLLRGGFEEGYLFPFYIRRFLIHPLFILLLIPAFYYQQISKENKL